MRFRSHKIPALLGATALTAGLLCACSHRHSGAEDSDVVMTFETSEKSSDGWHVTTRATESLTDSYSVSASSILRPDTGSPGAFLKKYPLTFCSINGEVSKWIAKDYVWPVKGTMDFIAWGTSSKTQIPADIITFNGGRPDFDSNFESLCFSFGTALDGSADIIYSNLAAHASRHDVAVPLVFDHAMAGLVLAVRAGDQTTVDNLGISSIALKSVALNGTLTVTPETATDYSKLTALTSIGTAASWSDPNMRADYHLARFEEAGGSPVRLELEPKSQALFLVPELPRTDIIISYVINGSRRSFVYHCESPWHMSKLYTYNFKVTLKKIEAGAEEEQWNTEIGGSAYEPEWDVEIGTGAQEATWGEEIGGEGYEVTWSVEVSATALEAEWVMEIGSSATESEWNSEIGSGAGESGWNSETGAGASEENWKGETGGSAYEAAWIPGEEIKIGGDS